MNQQKLKLFTTIFILILTLASCSSKEGPNQEKSTPTKTNTTTGIVNVQNYVKTGDYKKAIEIYEKEIKKNDSIENQLALVNLYLKYGNSFYKEDEYSKKALEMLNKLKNETNQSLYYIGYANEISKNYNKSILNYEKALKISKDEKEIATLTNQIGHVYDLKGDLAKAKEYYKKSEDMGLNLPENLINRGRAEYRGKNYTLASSYFNKVLKMNIDSFTKAEMYFNLSTIELNTSRDLNKVIEYSNSGIKENPNYPNNYLNLGLAYIQKGGTDLDKAPKELDKALSINPNSTLAYKYKGVYYYVKDDFKNAIENFQKQYDSAQKDIILMENDRPKFQNEAYYDIAKSYALMGDETNTISYLDKVLPGENKVFYYGFLKDYSLEDGPFSKIQNNKNFSEYVIKNIKLYK